jgi:hypothetical protein
MSNPQYIVRLVGGPRPGERIYHDEDGLGWPPPFALEIPGVAGCYQRISYSQIDKETDCDYVIRGAEYEWQEPR